MRRVVLIAVVVLVALIPIGAWERERRADEESAGMRSVLEEVGSLDSQDLRGFRIFANFDCLVYERGRDDFALELCVDDHGRVVEAIDRRDGTPEVWSLRDDPSKSEIVVDRREVNRLLRRMNVPDAYLPDT
ncbi:MAG: hypothetical protein QOI67_1310 [Gaiellaceae bacterium]|nr:hypothetical protein [Gaiellaceae bacterium]